MAALLKFEYGLVVSYHSLELMDLLVHVEGGVTDY